MIILKEDLHGYVNDDDSVKYVPKLQICCNEQGFSYLSHYFRAWARFTSRATDDLNPSYSISRATLGHPFTGACDMFEVQVIPLPHNPERVLALRRFSEATKQDGDYRDRAKRLLDRIRQEVKRDKATRPKVPARIRRKTLRFPKPTGRA